MEGDPIEGKVVMVTGASSGIGRDLCLYLAKAGCRVVVAARRIDRLISLCDQINNNNNNSTNSSTIIILRAAPVELDISADGSAIEASVGKAWSAFGRIDALVNNAGVRGTVKSALELLEEEWNSIFKTNLTGSWLVSKYVCIRMREAGLSGSIINISSIAGLDRGNLPGGVAYSASKAGINSITKMMALELGEHKIRVNAIAPGLFKSEITEGLMQKHWLDTVAKRTVPLRTYGTADPALTSLVRYLIQDSSEYVSGNIFIVDAGVTLPDLTVSPVYQATVGKVQEHPHLLRNNQVQFGLGPILLTDGIYSLEGNPTQVFASTKRGVMLITCAKGSKGVIWS